MTSGPAVSVLMPAYNVAEFVEAAVRSVQAQTFVDWEIVAVDDASNDSTLALLRELASGDARLRVIEGGTNVGMTANWNRALAHARGEFVIKLDPDDMFRTRALEVLAGPLRSPGVVAAGARTLLCDAAMEPFGALPSDEAMVRAGIDPYHDAVLPTRDWYEFAAHGQQLWHSCAIMVRRETLVAGGGWDERFGCASDTELVWRMLESDGAIAHSGYVAVHYRIRSQSVSDVFRSMGWLMWEGIAANLQTLHRARSRRGLSWPLRLRYASLWSQWSNAQAEIRQKLPPPIFEKLTAVVEELEPPALMDVALWRTRRLIERRGR